jgi:hypothetical protein
MSQIGNAFPDCGNQVSSSSSLICRGFCSVAFGLEWRAWMSGARAWDNLLRGKGSRGGREYHSAGLFGLPLDIVATNLSLCPIGITDGLLQPGPASRCNPLNFAYWVGARCNKSQPDLESPKASEPWPWRRIRKTEPGQEHLHVRRLSGIVNRAVLLIFTLSCLVKWFLTEEFKIPAVSTATAEV